MNPAPDPGELATVLNDLHVQATYCLTEALATAEKKMRRRVELLSEVVFETDAAGRLLFLNKAWKTTLGYAPDASIGLLLHDFVLPDDRAAFDAAFHEPGYRASVGPLQFRFRCVDRRTVWMECTATALDEGGFVGALRDVTQQKRTQDELERLSLVASSTDNLVVITDRGGAIEWVNHAFTGRTGYQLEEVVGRKPGALLQGAETDPETVAKIARWLGEGCSFSTELLNYTKSGEPYWASIYVTPVRNAAGEIERFISVQTDSTNLRRTQQQLEVAKRAAETANEAKTQFLATISHEMRTPLNVILGATELALEGISAANYLQNLKRIQDNGDTLLHLISDLLDVSKIEAGQIEFERSDFRLRTCLGSALEAVREKAHEKGLEFNFLCDESLPESITGDPARLRQVLSNLAENAVKFTDAGFVRVEAILKPGNLKPGSPVLELVVRDSGVGIPPEHQSSIFERFVQADRSTTRSKGGAGLGLSIVKSLVEAMGGSVRVESKPGQGARFYVNVPLTVAGSPVATHARQEHAGNHPVQILVAEDNDSNYAIVERHLSNAGYRVLRAVNGRHAVDAASETRFGAVLMDVETPEMDGLEATRKIREAEALRGLTRMPIIALTAHAVNGYKELCLESGCSGYLAKPVRKQALLEALADALQTAQ